MLFRSKLTCWRMKWSRLPTLTMTPRRCAIRCRPDNGSHPNSTRNDTGIVLISTSLKRSTLARHWRRREQGCDQLATSMRSPTRKSLKQNVFLSTDPAISNQFSPATPARLPTFSINPLAFLADGGCPPGGGGKMCGASDFPGARCPEIFLKNSTKGLLQ